MNPFNPLFTLNNLLVPFFYVLIFIIFNLFLLMASNPIYMDSGDMMSGHFLEWSGRPIIMQQENMPRLILSVNDLVNDESANVLLYEDIFVNDIVRKFLNEKSNPGLLSDLFKFRLIPEEKSLDIANAYKEDLPGLVQRLITIDKIFALGGINAYEGDVHQCIDRIHGRYLEEFSMDTYINKSPGEWASLVRRKLTEDHFFRIFSDEHTLDDYLFTPEQEWIWNKLKYEHKEAMRIIIEGGLKTQTDFKPINKNAFVNLVNIAHGDYPEILETHNARPSSFIEEVRDMPFFQNIFDFQYTNLINFSESLWMFQSELPEPKSKPEDIFSESLWMFQSESPEPESELEDIFSESLWMFQSESPEPESEPEDIFADGVGIFDE